MSGRIPAGADSVLSVLKMIVGGIVMGEWVAERGLESVGKYICSNCGYRFFACSKIRDEPIRLYKFCPDCGERMETGDKEQNERKENEDE